jgi:hypothetical protein
MLRSRKSLLAVVLGVVLVAAVVAFVSVQAQQKTTGKLTALDYAEIQQLNAHYAHALDSCADRGYEYARLYTSDGVFTNQKGVKFEGRERLSEAARGGPACRATANPLSIGHIIVNVMIEPSADGAVGTSVMFHAKVTEEGKPGSVGSGGKYYDTYVKTSEGWRFKTRAYVEAPHLEMIPAFARASFVEARASR